MKLTFDQSQCFSVPEKLLNILNTELTKLTGTQPDSTGITFNFRDPDYSADTGGYHPVEIRVTKHMELWQFEYITDFCFEGFPYPELVKDIDVCFHTQKIYTQFDISMSKQEADDFFSMFLNNFISYVEMGVFTVKVTFD
ncbi:MAG: hypothetical protein ACJAS1_002677 [Oleiphilaceae bacterium]|jgi:hypothetical protein